MTSQQNILLKIKSIVSKIDPQAQIILYGSRSTGKARPDSDWDFLILTNSQVNYKT